MTPNSPFMILRPEDLKDREVPEKPKSGLSNPERIYLDQLSATDLLSKEEELFLMQQIDRYRTRWRMLILTTTLGLRKALELLESIHRGESSGYRALDTKGEEDQEKARKKITKELKSVISEVRGLSREIQQARLRMRDAETSPEIQIELRGLIKQLSLQAAERIESSRINIKYFKPWMEEIHAVGREMLKQIRIARGDKGDEEKGEEEADEVEVEEPDPEKAKKELLQLEEVHDETSAFAKRLFSMRRRLDEYERMKEALCNANLRLVVSIAKHYQHRGLTLDDLIQEGNIGLMIAAEGVEWRMGNRFSTYASRWIPQAIGRALKTIVRTVQVPVSVEQSLGKMKRAEDEFLKREERHPTDEELAKEMGIALELLLKIKEAEMGCLSLNFPSGREGDDEIGDNITNEQNEDDAGNINLREARKKLEKVLSTLGFREREILKLRFGLADGYVYNLEEIGTIFKVSRERIRQIEQEGLKKLIDPARKKMLLGLVDS